MSWFKQTFAKNKVYLLIFVFIIMAHLPVALYKIVFIKPALILMTIFFFSIFKETRPSQLILILFGLIEDFLGSFLIGISSFSYVLISLCAIVNTRGLLQQRFNVVWIVLAISLAIVYCLNALALSVYMQSNYFTQDMLVEYLASILLYPLLHLVYLKKINWFRN